MREHLFRRCRMAKPHLPDSVIRERLDFARSVDWNFDICANHWKISRGGVICFLNKQKEYRNRNKTEPEPQVEDGPVVYENQRLFDIQVLTKEEWCIKWDVPLWEYNKYLKKYEQECGEELATPERRAKWQQELDEKELRELFECKMPCRECLDKARWEAYTAGWIDALTAAKRK